MSAKLLFLAFIIITSLSGISAAQRAEGALVGTVMDSAGARVAGATVSVETRALKQGRKTSTNADGEFRLESLPPGDYRVTVSATGFAAAGLDVKVAVSSSPTLTITLKPSGISETVQVQGAVSLTAQP